MQNGAHARNGESEYNKIIALILFVVFKIIYFFTVLSMAKLNCTPALIAFVVEKRRKTGIT